MDIPSTGNLNKDVYSQVDRILDASVYYASQAEVKLNSFTAALESTLYTAPVLNIAWTSLADPEYALVNPAPDLTAVTFSAPTEPTLQALPSVTISIDDFTEVAPTLPSISAPTVSIGTAPSVPAVGAVSIPDAPTIDVVALPSYLALSTPTFAGVDLHLDWLDKLDEIPELSLVSPTPFSYALGPEYASALLSSLQNTLNARLAGGTGLSPAVEQAIWDRGRDRETNIMQGNIDDLMRTSEALGYDIPAGVIAAQLREAEQKYYDALSTLSRDVSVKQAELEQENLKQTIAAGMQLEGMLIDQSLKLEQMAFNTAKEYADNAVAIYNAGVEAYKAILAGYAAYAAAYKTIIEAELAKVEVYKAELMGEQTKASINNTLVQQYKAQIEASMALVEIYKAQVGGAEALIRLEQAKISAAGEQIRAFTAQVNAETAKVEVYKTQIQAQSLEVDMYKAKAQAYSAVVGAQAEEARVHIAEYSAIANANATLYEGYKAKISASTAQMNAIVGENSKLIDAYRAEAAATEANAKLVASVWEAKIKEYEASQMFMLEQGKINNAALMQANQSRNEAAKVGAQVYSQLSASAYGMMHSNASIQGQTQNSVSFSYKNATDSKAATIISVGG